MKKLNQIEEVVVDTTNVDMNSPIPVIKTISQDDKNINNYFDNAKTVVNYNNNSVDASFHRLDFHKSNTFIVNPFGMSNVSIVEVDNITDRLLNIFPDTPSGLEKFDTFTIDGQIWSSPCVFNVEDYAICEFNGYIITFHLDLFNGLGTTINNIVPKSSVVMKQDFITYQFNNKGGK